MPPKKRSKRRGSQETERMSTRARSPEVDQLSCVPETQQAAGVEELAQARAWLTKGARSPQFSSVLSRNRSQCTFCVAIINSLQQAFNGLQG